VSGIAAELARQNLTWPIGGRVLPVTAIKAVLHLWQIKNAQSQCLMPTIKQKPTRTVFKYFMGLLILSFNQDQNNRSMIFLHHAKNQMYFLNLIYYNFYLNF